MCLSTAVCIHKNSACEVPHVQYEEQEPKQQEKKKSKKCQHEQILPIWSSGIAVGHNEDLLQKTFMKSVILDQNLQHL